MTLLMTLILWSCTAPNKEPAHPFIGACKLTKSTHVYVDTTIVRTGFKYSTYKLFTASRFAFGFMSSDTTLIGGGGIYTYDEDSCSETIKYHEVPRIARKVLKFNKKIEGDTWYHSGTIIREVGEVQLEKIWVKVK